MTAEKAPQFTVWQSLLPNRLGISIDEVRARRKAFLNEGVDWVQDGNRVLLTAEAEQKLRQSLSIAPPANGTAPPNELPQKSATGQPPKNAALPALLVFRSAPQIRNRRIVEVYAEGTAAQRENILLLWVKNNAQFRPGQRIPPAAIEARAPGQFTYIASRPPR